MKVVLTHTDLRIYWVPRIKDLQSFLLNKGIELDIIEICGKGGTYGFDKNTKDNIKNWNTLFPDADSYQLSAKKMSNALYKKLSEINPDIIIAGAIAFSSGATATRWAKENKKKVIIFDDAKNTDTKRNKIIEFIKYRIYQNVDAMLYPSKDWSETGKYWNFQLSQLFYGIDVVDNVFWQKKEKTTKSSLKNDYFLFVGRLIEVKNLPFLLYAYKTYRSKIKDLTKIKDLVLIGDGPEREILKKIIKNECIEGVYIHPFLSQTELIGFYHNASAFILPSTSETWGLVINEALASGLPVLASKNCGATQTLIQHQSNGYVFSPYNIQELTNAMLEFSSLNSRDRESMSQKALNSINEWGLDRFCTGCYEAIQYVQISHKKKNNLLDFLLLKMWKGRYNPV